jgi:hypothetical protein
MEKAPLAACVSVVSAGYATAAKLRKAPVRAPVAAAQPFVVGAERS